MAEDKALQLVTLLKERGLTITAAESCTGGRIAASITAISGSSAVFPGSVVSYCDEVKHSVLHVPAVLLERFGAVSAQVAEAMAEGVAALMQTDLAVSATGLAGPSGDGSENPVGTVFLGLYSKHGTIHEHHVFSGDREAVQRQACSRAIEMTLAYLRQQ